MTPDERATLENAADLLEELGHAGCQVIRELLAARDEIRAPQIITPSIVRFLLDGGEVLMRGSYTSRYPAITVRALVPLTDGSRIEAGTEHDTNSINFSSQPDMYVGRHLSRNVQQVVSDGHWTVRRFPLDQ